MSDDADSESVSNRSGGADLTPNPSPVPREGRSGGADLNAQGDISVNGDAVGRDKITQTTVYEAPAIGVASLHQLPPLPPDLYPKPE